MNFEKEIRKLARSTFWQNLFQGSKELSNMALFFNTSNFSGLQILFIYWLKVYHSIYEDFYSKEYDFLDEELINDNVRCDAFLYWRQKKHESERLKYKEEEKGRQHIKGSKQGKQTYCNVDMRSV
ncbi:MAG: hypothetical protein M0R03_12465 [Novosphingobium sp.]|nr:hypothetical protein [Novosphingobium sp.]